MAEKNKAAKAVNKGGVLKKKQKRTYREIFEAILTSDIPKNEDIGKIAMLVMESFPVKSIDEATAFAVTVAAMNGDMKAFEIIRDATGQKGDNKLQTGKVIIQDDIS